jgi:hypothetical protein
MSETSPETAQIEPEAASPMLEAHEHVEPEPAQEATPFQVAETAQAEIAPVAEPESDFIRDSRFAIPDREPADLARRVVWREAPMDTETSHHLGGGLKGMSLLLLVVRFLVGLAVFAGGIVWGLNAKGSGVISWILGLVGIVCVVSAVYVYLERLGGRED